MGIAISQVLASFEPRFYAWSIVGMAPRRLKKHSSSDEFNREIVILILPQGPGAHFTPTDPYCIIIIAILIIFSFNFRRMLL